LAKPLSKQELLARIKTHLNLLKINSSYSRFVPHDYLRFLNKESILDVHLGDNISKEMAIMFSDIRSFTTMSEGMTPQESFDFVNAYLRRVGPTIRTNNGLIVKFLGDGVMAVFPTGAEDGIKAGIEKLRQVTEYNIHRRQDGWQPIRIGIGMHLGYIMVGIVGEAVRMEGDTLSDNVNLTSRLEGLTKYYGVSLLVSEEMLKNLSDPDQFYTRFLDKVQVKGKEQAISVYEVFNADPDILIQQKLKTKSDFETGQHYYFDKEFAEAIGCFKNVLTINPDDATAKLYLQRATQFLVHGVPEGWQGIERRTSK
ncbi:MAG: adenylate/guanylate cyclase domain-containing protein, partial [bacterium]|nr:adenylate/guanylate cyclase domain-containing protein [bacterium]